LNKFNSVYYMIRKWWIKCAVQKGLSHVPFGRKINDLWRYRTNRTWFDEFALEQGLIALNMLQHEGFDLHGKTVLEFGSGRRPIIPFLYRIAGCEKVILCDLFRIMSYESLKNTILNMRNRASLVSSELGISKQDIEAILPQRVDRNFEELLSQGGFEYRAPLDVRKTDYPNESIDVIASRTVLEHIPVNDLRLIMKEMRRIIKPDGVMVHIIDTSDHWQHFDRSLSRINFLKFSPGWWKVINSPIAYQNRLRVSEHLEIIRNAGFEISSIKTEAHKESLDNMESLKIHRFFSERFSPEELAVISAYMIAYPLRRR